MKLLVLAVFTVVYLQTCLSIDCFQSKYDNKKETCSDGKDTCSVYAKDGRMVQTCANLEKANAAGWGLGCIEPFKNDKFEFNYICLCQSDGCNESKEKIGGGAGFRNTAGIFAVLALASSCLFV
eukprot:TRINITY_DN9772_c0_g1_i1.p1 TRINITY_DN9772_c0_g1~~TRINITY_DN9772_c0_g1_i1.p1  ORF type:complete len:124 (+),score=7.22 TRINITY_DN9772_c0_g1_i1:37-408(+)